MINRANYVRSVFALGTIAAAALLGACGGGGSSATVPAEVSNQLYSQSNLTANTIVHMSSIADGSLTVKNTVATTGAGTNSGPDPLTSQYSVIVTPDHRTLFAVNAGDNSVSSFAVDAATGNLTLLMKNPTTGVMPVSLAYSNGHIYVLFQGSKTVQAYAVTNGVFGASLGSYVLPAATTTATEITATPNGANVLVSAGTGSNSIVSYPVAAGGTLGAPVVNTAGIHAPFAAAFLNATTLLSTDAGGHALQSLNFNQSTGMLAANGASVVGDGAGNPCWLAITPNGKFAYTGDGGSGTISSYGVSSVGILTLINPRAASENIAVAGDSWISADGKFLYSTYLAQGVVITYSIGSDGALTKVGSPATVAAGTTIQGLAGI